MRLLCLCLLTTLSNLERNAHGIRGNCCVIPWRHPEDQGREGAGEIPGRRGPGGLPPAGRQDQRQAH